MNQTEKMETQSDYQMPVDLAEKLREEALTAKDLPKNNANVDGLLPRVTIKGDQRYSGDKWLQDALSGSPFYVSFDSDPAKPKAGELGWGRNGLSCESQFQYKPVARNSQMQH